MSGIAVGSWVPYIPERAQALGLSAGRLGTVLLGAGLGAVLAMPLTGKLVPQLGSRRVSIVAGVGFAGALSLAALAPSWWALVLALVTFGLCGAAMDIAMNAQAVLIEERTGRRILSSLHGLYSLGNVAGSFGVSAAFGWHVRPAPLVLAISAASLAAVLGCWPTLLEEDAHGGANSTEKRSFAPRLLLIGSLVVAAMTCEGATADWSGLYLRQVRALGPGWAGVGFGIFSGFMLAGRLLGDWLVERMGQVRTLRVGGALGAGGAALVVLGPGLASAFAGFALLGLGLANASPILYRAAGHVRGVPAGTGLATAVGMGYAGLLAGPPALGGVAQTFGLGANFLVVASLCALLGLSARIGSPRR